MKLSDSFPSQYLKSTELAAGQSYVLTITDITPDGPDGKPVFHFAEGKSVVMNKTNCNVIAALFGTDEVEELIGRQVTIYRTRVSFQGKLVDAIRVDDRPTANQPPIRKPAAALPQKQTAPPASRNEPPPEDYNYDEAEERMAIEEEEAAPPRLDMHGIRPKVTGGRPGMSGYASKPYRAR